MLQLLLLLLSSSAVVSNGLQSRPFVPYRTSPYDQKVHHNLTLSSTLIKSKPRFYSQKTASDNTQCPLQFTLGLSKRSHTAHSHKSLSIVQPPVIYPVHPSRGPGRQVLHTTLYEHLDLLTPSFKEGLVQEPDFPLLFESSSFAYTHPILHDVNGDGVMDAIVADYDGGIYFVGLSSASNYFHKAQVPRLYLRRDWMIHRLNETSGIIRENTRDDPYEPYHSHFEYLSSHDRGVLQGVTANLLKQDNKDAISLSERRRRDPVAEALGRGEQHHHDGEMLKGHNVAPQTEEEQEEEQEKHDQEAVHRRQNIAPEAEEEQEKEQEKHDQEAVHRRLQEVPDEKTQEQKPQDPVDNAEEHASRNNVEHQEEEQADNRVQENATEQKVKEDHFREENASGNNVEHQETRQTDGSDTHAQENVVEQKGEENHPHEPDAVERREEQQAEGSDTKVQDHAAEQKIEEDRPHEPVEPFDTKEMDQESERVREFDDDFPSESIDEESKDSEEVPRVYDDDRAREDDYYNRKYGYDDYYRANRNTAYDEYYDNKNYVRIPPHILCTPVLAEMPRLYGGQNEMEDMLFVAVSYYLDEDEYEGFFSYKRFDNVDHGDETEVQRGMYVASAILVYNLGDYPRWARQEQLDLSGDATAPQNATLVGEYPIVSHETKLGAFALSSPTVADIDGDGEFDILMGTSMGMVYRFDARNLFNKDGWPVQMKHAVESRILVEDVVGDTDLEIFVTDTGGNIICFDKQGSVLWHRDLVNSIEEGAELLGSSPMSLGDVDGDGTLDLVIVLKLASENKPEMFFIAAISAVDGGDLSNFPIAVESKTVTDQAEKDLHQKLPQPLLVDLHADQSHWKSLFNRSVASGEPVKTPPKPPHGGSARGLHVVQPIGSDLFIIEAGSGCIQTISIGDEVTAMVQADDVHGTDRIDLVISTASGSILTLESPAVPYHPLNVWNNGEVRGRRNSFAQGYSASQGIFVHKVSRRYRDIFGVYVPVTFEIFDQRPSIENEPARRVYNVEFRDGTSSKRAVMRKEYNSTGVFTERIYIPYGPGYYTLSAMLRTTHGLIYEDTFHLGYNVHFMDGFGLLLWLPLVLAAVPIFFCGRKKLNWEDEDFDDGARGERGLGILGRALPLTAT